MCVVIPIVWSSQVQDLKAKWDGDGNGKLDRTEFTKHIKALGFEATDEDYVKLFDGLDSDGSESLASKELVSALGKLKQESVNKIEVEQNQIRVTAQARKAAEQAQVRLRAMKVGAK